MIEYCNEYDLLYEEAQVEAGFSMNDVGLSHVFHEFSGLDRESRRQIFIHHGHDLRRYEETRTAVRPMGNETQPSQLPSSRGYYGKNGTSDCWCDWPHWYEPSDSWYQEYEDDGWHGDY